MRPLFVFLSKWKNLLVLFSLFLLANFFLSQFMPKEQALDLKFAYTVDDAYQALNELDQEERARYEFGILAFDMPYLLIYGLLFSGILLKLFKNNWIVLLPFSIMVMDFFENLFVLRILQLFPIQNEKHATFASIFTSCKWVLIGILVVLSLVGLVLLVVKKMLPKSNFTKTKN